MLLLIIYKNECYTEHEIYSWFMQKLQDTFMIKDGNI